MANVTVDATGSIDDAGSIADTTNIFTDDKVMEILELMQDDDILDHPLLEFDNINGHQQPRKVRINMVPMSENMQKIVLEDFIYRLDKSITCEHGGTRDGCYGKMLWVKNSDDEWCCRCNGHTPRSYVYCHTIHIDLECDNTGTFYMPTLIKAANKGAVGKGAVGKDAVGKDDGKAINKNANEVID